MEPISSPAFEALVADERDAFIRFLQPAVAGSRVDPEDALQDGLERVLLEGQRKGLPSDPAQCARHVMRALNFAARDAIKRTHGRGGARDFVRPVDLQAVAEFDAFDDRRVANVDAAAVGAAIYRDAQGRDDADRVVERSVLVAALGALSEVEVQVLRAAADGLKPQAIAKELGLSPGQVKRELEEARHVMRGLIAHAAGAPVDDEYRALVFAYADGELRNPHTRRRVKRHLKRCEECQRVLELERGVERTGAHVLAPLPLVIFGARAASAAAGGAAAVSLGSSGLAASGTVGTSAAALVSGSGGAKLAAAIAAAAVVTGGAAAVKHEVDANAAKQKASRATVTRAYKAAARRTSPVRLVDPLPGVDEARHRAERARQRARRRRPRRRKPATVTPPTAQRTAPVSAPSAPPASSGPQTTSATAASPAPSGGGGAGGEFLIGGP